MTDQGNGGRALTARARQAAAALLLFGVVVSLAFAGCEREPEPSVDTTCPGGRSATAALAISLKPVGLSLEGAPRRVRVHGVRISDDTCYAQGSPVIFASELKEPSPLNVALPTLADGEWLFAVTALPEAEHEEPVEIKQTLPAGGSATLTISAGPAREISVSFGGT